MLFVPRYLYSLPHLVCRRFPCASIEPVDAMICRVVSAFNATEATMATALVATVKGLVGLSLSEARA